MDYITSRGFLLPKSEEEFGRIFWFNLWSKRLWPYRELERGDVLFWYQIPTRAIVWKSVVEQVMRCEYKSKRYVQDRLMNSGILIRTNPTSKKLPKRAIASLIRPLR